MTALLVIGALGLVLLAVSLVLGDLFDGVADALAGDVFSSAVIGAFVSAFGFGAAIAASAGTGALIAAPVGVGSGLVFGWFAVWLTRLIKDGGSDATPTLEATVGRDAAVVTDIPLAGYGIVVVRLGGHTLRLNAKARSGAVVESGTSVHVTAVLSPSAVEVAPVWELDLGPPLAPLDPMS